MSTITAPREPIQPQAMQDPFRYGFRDVEVVGPNGQSEWQQIPLTLEDVLHPQLGDKVMNGSLHAFICLYLKDVFAARTADDPSCLVLQDTGVFWDDPELKHHSPDICVIRGLRRRLDNWPVFRVAEEGKRPRLIVEVVSPATRVNDVETKFDQYHRAGVKTYVIIDRLTNESPWQLRGYQNTPKGYQPLPLDESGRLWVDEVQVWLGVDGHQIVCFDEKDAALGNYTQLSQQLEIVRVQAEAEAQRAEAEHQRAEALAQRAEAEAQRADNEAAARLAFEEQVKLLQAKLADQGAPSNPSTQP